MPQFLRDHIIINGRTQVLPYTSTSLGRPKVKPRPGLNRAQHGADIRQQFNAAVEGFRTEMDNDFVYLVFRSPWDFLLDLEKFDKSHCRLATYKLIEVMGDDEQVHKSYEAAVYLNKRAIAEFLKKVQEYIIKTTPVTYKADGSVKGGGNPFHLPLIANIEEIRTATLESFWQEPELPFPNPEEIIWWEAWLSRVENEDENSVTPIFQQLQEAGIQISQRNLKFPEHYVYLMRGSANQLSTTLLYTDRLAEIRKPRETADFFTYLDRQDQNNWVHDLVGRTDHLIEHSTVSVCLLDTGVNITNPLLANLIPEDHLATTALPIEQY